MSRFIDTTVSESWRMMLDRVPVIGKKINDRLNKPMIDKFLNDPKVRKFIKEQTKKDFDEEVETYASEPYVKDHKLSLKKPSSKLEPIVDDRSKIRTMDDREGLLSYEYNIDGVHYIVATDGKTIRRVSLSYYEYDPHNDIWSETIRTLTPPDKDTIYNMWNPIEYEYWKD